jgi:hypothetical protein
MPLSTIETRSGSPSKKAKTGPSVVLESGKGGDRTSRKQTDNLDYRVRVLEPVAFETYQFDAEDGKLSEFLKKLIADKKGYDDMRPSETGKGHDWGPERHTLCVGLIQYIVAAVGTAGYLEAMMKEPGTKAFCDSYEEFASILQKPSLSNQFQGIIAFDQQCTKREDVQTEIAHFQLVLTKAKTHKLLRLVAEDSSLLQACMPLVRLVFHANKGKCLDGTAPKGFLFHEGKKSK